MTTEQAKQELVKRYRYLYQNAYFILAPYMYEQNENEYKKMIREFANVHGREILSRPLIYLNILRSDIVNSLFEEFLLSDKTMEESKLYQLIENNRDNKEYIEKVKIGLELVEKDNKNINCEILKSTLDLGKILEKVTEYLEEQSGDLKNKKRKLRVIDEYYRIYRYKNNGKIYTSGRNLNLHDVSSIIVPRHEKILLRDKKDIGVESNIFIETITSIPYNEDNYSIFTENEKQEIYLYYHDELPCDLEIACAIEEDYIQSTIETRLYRPENTEPCGETFIIKEEEIFVNPNYNLYRYYQMCPHCGYMVNIPKEILSNGIKQRIEDRCSKDDKLFRKMFLYSELFSLDKKSNKGQKTLLKK